MCIQDANLTHDDKAIVYCDILSWILYTPPYYYRTEEAGGDLMVLVEYFGVFF